MATGKIDNVLEFTKGFWSDLASDTLLRIDNDALKGKFQNDRKNIPLYSKQYKDYKSRRMQGKTLGRKIKPYTGRQIVSNQTAYSDMHLTGETFRHATATADKDNKGFTVKFSPKDAGKIIGNEKYGRVIVGLSKENEMFVVNEILKNVDKNIRKDFAKQININIG